MAQIASFCQQGIKFDDNWAKEYREKYLMQLPPIKQQRCCFARLRYW